LVRILAHQQNESGGISRIDKTLLKRKFAAVLINNPSGFRQLWEEEHGVEHSRKGRHFPPGRHTSSKRKAVRR